MDLAAIVRAPGASLAPMAGASDAVMRRLCAEFGATFTVSEMVSAKALVMGDAKSRRLYAGGGGEAPFAIQLFGAEPADMAAAVRLVEADPNARFGWFDINMGCPVPKVVKTGAGSALMRTPAAAARLVEAAVKAATRPVSVKMRIGWDAAECTGVAVAKAVEAAGAAMIAVHARTREQLYAPGVDYAAVAAMKAAVRIPVVANGDIDSGEAALAALKATGADGVMIGRAAEGAPWLFAQVKAVMAGETPPAPPTLRVRLALLERQVRALCEAAGEEAGMRQARGVAAAYVKGLRGAASLRRQAHGLEHFADLDALCAAVLRLDAEKNMQEA